MAANTGAKAYPVDGLNVVITGAGRGIGKRLAIGLALRGSKVGLVARTGAELDLTDLEIRHAGGISHKLAAAIARPNDAVRIGRFMRTSPGSRAEPLD